MDERLHWQRNLTCMKSYSILYILFWLSTACFSQERYSIVIDEIMVDPSPGIGLPGNEWIELKNTSHAPINLKGWRIGDLTTETGPMENFLLEPDSFLIVCPASAKAAMAAFGPTLSASGFPTFDNEGDLIYLKNADGTTIHALRYTSAWYKNEMKKEGGWTLEMIDPHDACSGSENWNSSLNIAGGTPGRKNSNDNINGDESPPAFLNSFCINDTSVVIRFNEPVDSLTAANSHHYSIDAGLVVVNAKPLGPLFDEVELRLDNAMQSGMIYTIRANSIIDCSNNQIASANSIRTGIPVDILGGDLVINEILFDPRANGFDYVELFNNSKKIVDASNVYIANRNSAGQVSSIKTLSQWPIYIFPGDYFVITEDLISLQGQYLVAQTNNILILPSMPPFPDDAGSVVILNDQGNIVDEVTYTEDWHFKLIDDPQGVALERLDPSAPSNDPSNWHSAASTAGYGTPTYKNSQFIESSVVHAMIGISPVIFSPDNDGFADICTLQYQVKETGFVANVTIFDGLGRPVRNLVRNGILGLNGYWNWDGLNDKGLKLPIGPYIILTEMFNLEGKRERFKNVSVLSRKF